jgi:hypothetical protein
MSGSPEVILRSSRPSEEAFRPEMDASGGLAMNNLDPGILAPALHRYVRTQFTDATTVNKQEKGESYAKDLKIANSEVFDCYLGPYSRRTRKRFQWNLSHNSQSGRSFSGEVSGGRAAEFKSRP